MTSFGASVVKAALRAFTYPIRKSRRSLSRSLRYPSARYRPPKGIDFRVGEYRGVKVESFSQKENRTDCRVVFFHGGGYTAPMSNFYRKIAVRHMKSTRLDVFAIDYRTGGGLRHPALLEDCFAAYSGLAERFGDSIIAIGDSMGADLMLATCLRLRDAGKPLPRALVAVSPFLDFSKSGDTYRKNCRTDPLYGLTKRQSYAENEDFLRQKSPYIGGADARDPYLSPAFASFGGFPRTLIQCGAVETSECDAETLFSKLKEAGVPAVYTKFEGMFHDFQYLVPWLKESQIAWKEVCAFLLREADRRGIPPLYGTEVPPRRE